MDKLKPCPICGRDDDVVLVYDTRLAQIGYTKPRHFVDKEVVQVKSCCVFQVKWYDSDEEAIAAWNNRAALSHEATTDEEVQAAIEWFEHERESILNYAKLYSLPSGQTRAEESYYLAIRALQQMKPVEPCEMCSDIGYFEVSQIVTHEEFDINYCPNCGRRIELARSDSTDSTRAMIDSESTQSGAIRSARGDAE